ncbi:hypothetical protein [Mucilaginibacter sp. BT774]|uniref:hypothetical protein n=1 Tax=Mucilaginibacter sp. BT774 TaxID=3062276 RepID=UPI002675490E|nr:hypothetical protein [Mucilaginibacter sp. BT774]MDO3624723.1 hypothetical protein [Mucilaginibacter sp. BT774]
MSLLDQALKIDSNYITAYINKFSYQGQWKKHTDAIVTGEILLSFFPNQPEVKLVPDSVSFFLISLQFINDLFEACCKRQFELVAGVALLILNFGQVVDLKGESYGLSSFRSTS